MISDSKSVLSLNNLKILRPKVTKNLTNLDKKCCEFWPWQLGKHKQKKYCIRNIAQISLNSPSIEMQLHIITPV